MPNQRWEEPFFRRTYQRIRDESHEEAKAAVWQEQLDRYRAMKLTDKKPQAT